MAYGHCKETAPFLVGQAISAARAILNIFVALQVVFWHESLSAASILAGEVILAFLCNYLHPSLRTLDFASGGELHLEHMCLCREVVCGLCGVETGIRVGQIVEAHFVPCGGMSLRPEGVLPHT